MIVMGKMKIKLKGRLVAACPAPRLPRAGDADVEP